MILMHSLCAGLSVIKVSVNRFTASFVICCMAFCHPDIFCINNRPSSPESLHAWNPPYGRPYPDARTDARILCVPEPEPGHNHTAQLRPASIPVDQAIWRLNPPVTPSRSSTSPAKYSPGTFLDSMVEGLISRTLTPP